MKATGIETANTNGGVAPRQVLERVAEEAVGGVDAQDEQGDRDGEDAVAERDDPVDVAPGGRPLLRHELPGDESQALHLVALSDELVGRDLDALLGEVVVLDAAHHFPLRAVAADRKAELQTLGRAVLTGAADRERVPVAVPGRVHDALHRLDRGVRRTGR